jgi:WD40 repeat protein
LPESIKTLYTTIKAELGDEVPQALSVFGLESVSDIRTVLTSSNYIREEFSKNFPFPLVLWINDEVQKKLLRLAPDLESWATSVEFVIATDELSYELIYSLRQKAERTFVQFLDYEANKFMHQLTVPLDDRAAIESAIKDLESRSVRLEPELEVNVQFVLGRDAYVHKQIEAALAYYQQSLAFWQQNNNLEWQGYVLFHIGLCHYRNALGLFHYSSADLQQAENPHRQEEAKHSFQQCIQIFEGVQTPQVVNKFICQVGEILKHLEAWEELETVAEKSFKLHYTRGNLLQLAQDYGWLAEVALRKSKWKVANQLAEQALQTFAQVTDSKPQLQGFYRLLVARSQRNLGQIVEAVHNLEKARKETSHPQNPQLYTRILEELRSLHFEQGQYLEAFQIKQEQRSIEQQYGFRAFIGAHRLQPQRLVTNSASTAVDDQVIVAQEIVASGREQDVERLIKERISRNDRKLIVIHGPSGVGKSSFLDAGLVPILQQRAIGDRDALPVTLRFYSNWVEALGKLLSEALEKARGISLPTPPNSVEAIAEQLQKNAGHHLLTVLIFDQFEEFFFNYVTLANRRGFFEFLRICLNLPFVKIILSMREDYLHYLLECERVTNLEAINNDILIKHIRYYLGNFSRKDAKAVIQGLTERSRFYLDPTLITDLVEDLSRQLGEVRPIELQVVGAQLQAENIRTLIQYRQLGTKEKLVERYLEEVIRDCGVENRRIAQLVLYSLTDENGTRPLKTRTELVADLANLEAEVDKLDLVLQILVGAGLVFLLPEVPADRYQLVHDYLVYPIRQQEGAKLIAELEREKERRELAEAEQQRAQAVLNRVLKQQLQVTRIAGVGFAILGTLAGVFGVQVAFSGTDSQLNTIIATSKALFTSNRELEALTYILEGGRQLRGVSWVKPDTQLRVITELQNVVYKVTERNRLEGHAEAIYSVSFSPDARTLVSASADNTVKLWGRNGALLKTLKGHRNQILSAGFSLDGRSLATASNDGTIKLWSRDGTPLRTLKLSRSPTTVSFSPDGQTIISADIDGTVNLWDFQGRLIVILEGHQDRVYAAKFSSDARLIATASADKTVKVWNRDGKQLYTFKAHTDRVRDVSLSPDGRFIATASDDRTIRLWSLADSKLLKTLQGHGAGVYSVSFSPDMKILASASGDNTVKLWKLDGTLLQSFQGHTNAVYSVDFSPDGKLIASASADETIRLWRPYGIGSQTSQQQKRSSLNELMEYGCHWVRDYLENNPNVSKSDRHLCDGIGTQK